MIFSDWDRSRKWMVFTGLSVFVISFIIYSLTVAPTTSFWDCGEFIACSHTLSVMHPPGSPLYLLIGKIATMLPFFKDLGLRVNMFSVFISASTSSDPICPHAPVTRIFSSVIVFVFMRKGIIMIQIL